MELTALAAWAAEAASAALARSMGVSSAMAFVRGGDDDVENASALSCLLQGGESRTGIVASPRFPVFSLSTLSPLARVRRSLCLRPTCRRGARPIARELN
eukprot:scaffold120574_cov60-Phaeocystis_antarctica.AAC.1